MTTFGDKIRKLRKEKKMTQQKLCAWVMMSQVNILVLNRQGRFLNRQLLYLPVEL